MTVPLNNVCIWSFSGPCLLAFGLNTDIYSVNLRIQSECEKIGARKTSNTDTFYAVYLLAFLAHNDDWL